MSYPWNNVQNLISLKADGTGDVLRFEVGAEQVEVHLQNGSIHNVVHSLHGRVTRLDSSTVHSIVVGEGNAQRDVHHYLIPNGPSPWLRLGITHHRGFGTWSSLPHPFELHGEPGFEEVFFYLLKGESQRAVQVGRGVWCDGSNVDCVWPVKDRTWSVIPMGYHPVVGEPGVHVSYVWAYLAKKTEWEKI